MITIDTATDQDYTYLAQNDRHITAAVLTQKIQEGLILVVHEAATPIGWLRYNYFWDSIPFMNLLWIDEPKRASVGRLLHIGKTRCARQAISA